MSKQSRAKSRRHKKKVGTGAVAPVKVMAVRRMSEYSKYTMLNSLLDDLHRELYKKQNTWGASLINLFYCELWSELTREIEKQRKSKSKENVLNMIVDIKMYIDNK